MSVNTGCDCQFFRGRPCASRATQEDLLCDPCREARQRRMAHFVGGTSGAGEHGTASALDFSFMYE